MKNQSHDKDGKGWLGDIVKLSTERLVLLIAYITWKNKNSKIYSKVSENERSILVKESSRSSPGRMIPQHR